MVKLFLLNFFVSLSIYSSPLQRGMDALEDNNPVKAREEFDEFQRRLKIINDPHAKAHGHIALCWYFRQRGDFPRAMNHAYSAYLISHKKNFSYGLMKSLTYLGWNYTALGLLKAGKAHLFDAIELSSQGFIEKKEDEKGNVYRVFKKSKKSKVIHPMIWGLAAQELGHIHLIAGEIKKAKQIINTTYRFATLNKVDVGISESGNLLAKIELMEGNHTRALKIVERSLKAGRDCNCSPQNIAQSLVLKAEIIQKAPQLLKDKKEDAYSLIQEAKNFALDKGVDFYLAHALLLEVKNDKTMSFYEMEENLNKAIRIFDRASSPDQGLAFLEKAKVKIDDQELKVAHELIKKGIDLSAKNQVHQSVINIEFIDFLDRYNGNYKTVTKDLWRGYQKAKKQGQVELALSTGGKLLEKFKEKGLLKGQIKILRERLGFLRRQLQKETDEDLKKQKKEKIILAQQELGQLLKRHTRAPSFSPSS